MTDPRHVGVFTSTRADAGPLSSVLQALRADERTKLTVIASGTHLSDAHGRTIDDLDVDPEELTTIPTQLGPRTDEKLAATGDIARGVGRVLEERHLDVLIVLGDRWELLPLCVAALLHQVPIAHIHGGEITEGAIDDRIRHAVTKMADVHFCATEVEARRIRQLGEPDHRIHVVGAPALDRFRDLPTPDRQALGLHLGLELRPPLGLVTFHPPTIGEHDLHGEATAVFETAARHLGSVVANAPGADPGADIVWRCLEEAAERHPHFHVVPHLGRMYPLALSTADVMVGNSSSGVLEAASFRLPVVDVGNRQSGRTRGANVLQAEPTPEALDAAIAQALSPAFRESLVELTNPYGDGRAGERIVDALVSSDLRPPLTPKPFVEH